MNGLVFLESSFLWALFSLIIVIGIHFLKKPKTKTFYFSTLRFFDKTTISSYKAEKIRKWLLLFVRTAIFVLLILLFANPSCNIDSLSLITSSQNELYVLTDPTPSMSYKINNTTLGDSAISLIDLIVKSRDSKKGVFVYNHKSNIFHKYTEEKSKFFYLKYHFNKRKILNAIENVVKSSKRPFFLVLSDFQEESTYLFEIIFSNPFLKKIPVIFIPLIPENPSNVAIVDINIDNLTENRFHIKTAVDGKQNYTADIITTFEEDIRAPTVRCTLSRDTTLTLSLIQNNNSWGKINIDTRDPLAFDNIYYFTKNNKKTWKILIIGEKIKNLPIDIALNSLGSNYWKIESLSPEQITSQNWEEADLIIFNNPNTTMHKVIESYKNLSKKKKNLSLCYKLRK